MEPKFDKKRCLKCMYSIDNGNANLGYPVKVLDKKKRKYIVRYIYCNYATVTGDTCLKAGPNYTTIDIRGDGPKCKLFKEGKSVDTAGDMERFLYGKQRPTT